MDRALNSRRIKDWSRELGFSHAGISKAVYLEEESGKLERWLRDGMHGNMHYMENWFDKRLDPTLLVPGARSVISLAFNYYPRRFQRPDIPQISKYAYGEDYHFVVKNKLKALMERIRSEIGEVDGRAFVDSGPVLERPWAAKSGLGWVGRHSLLLDQDRGSFFFLAELILDLELEADRPVVDRCGTCTKCMDACPTDAIVEPYVVDARKCISYMTIELKDEIPAAFAGKFGNWMFGCDICQDVCPWNRFSVAHMEKAFEPREELLSYTAREWTEITEDIFADIFKKSAVKRAKYAGLKRNLEFLAT